MKNITLVAIDFLWHDLTRRAIEISLDNIDPQEVLIISDREIVPGARHVIQDPVADMNEYANIMLKGVNKHVSTDHALFVQWDGIANNRELWTNDFLQYDYIGAPWPWEPEGRNIGNGGFSLRSKRLLEACQDSEIALTEKRGPAEDNIIGSDKREYLETAYGIKFAPTDLAKQFSYELGEYNRAFGFHGLWNVFVELSESDVNYYASRINFLGWNIYKWHHVLKAVIDSGRIDLYTQFIAELEKNNPELLSPLAQWLERDLQNPMPGFF